MSKGATTMIRILKSRLAIALVTAVLTASVVGGIAWAAQSPVDGSGVIHGCYNPNTGVVKLRVNATCPVKGATTPISWNQQGPPAARAVLEIADFTYPASYTDPVNVWSPTPGTGTVDVATTSDQDSLIVTINGVARCFDAEDLVNHDRIDVRLVVDGAEMLSTTSGNGLQASGPSNFIDTPFGFERYATALTPGTHSVGAEVRVNSGQCYIHDALLVVERTALS